MARRIEDIEARIAEAEKHRSAEDEKEKRIFEAAAKFYGGREKREIAGLETLLGNLKIPSEGLNGFFKAQEKEAKSRLDEVTPVLQLTREEISFYHQVEKAIIQINPCFWVHSSPDYKCVYYAYSGDCASWATANASATCTINLPNNEMNPRVDAFGQGSNGLRLAYVHCWVYFDIPARPNPTTVNSTIFVPVHGFYILRSAGLGKAHAKMNVEAEAYQYGYSWDKDVKTCVDVQADSMARYDANEYLHLSIPAGADPFLVRVSVKLWASAKSGGSMAVCDFGTGNGNYVKIWWVNTISPD